MMNVIDILLKLKKSVKIIRKKTSNNHFKKTKLIQERTDPMGYTRYWYRTDKRITPEFVDAVNEIITDCNKKGITIKNGSGKNSPVVNVDCISINGNSDINLNHETMYMNNTELGFNFCKTARKPYDYAVRRILTVAEKMGLVENVSSDGPNEEIISDADYYRNMNNETMNNNKT